MIRKLLVPFALAAALLGAAVPAYGKGGTGQVSVGAVSSCDAGWTLAVVLTVGSPLADLTVDVSDDTGMLQSGVVLSFGQAYRFTLPASGRRDTINVYVHQSLQQLGRTQVDNPCPR